MSFRKSILKPVWEWLVSWVDEYEFVKPHMHWCVIQGCPHKEFGFQCYGTDCKEKVHMLCLIHRWHHDENQLPNHRDSIGV